MPSSVAQGKTGLRAYLQATEGLRPADKVTVLSGAVEPVPATKMVVLGKATTTEAQAGLARRAETVALLCWVLVTKSGSGETAIQAARDDAYQLRALIGKALQSDPTAAGAVPDPGHIDITGSELDEVPVTWDGQAAQRAELQLQLSWTSHITP